MAAISPKRFISFAIDKRAMWNKESRGLPERNK